MVEQVPFLSLDFLVVTNGVAAGMFRKGLLYEA